MIVVDASIVATALADDGLDGDVCRARLRTEVLAAPYLIDLEIASVLRRLTSRGQLSEQRSLLALNDLIDLPMARAPHVPLLKRCWELRTNVTAYDAAYIALAEKLDTVLLTNDVRLSRASGPRCKIEVLRAI